MYLSHVHVYNRRPYSLRRMPRHIDVAILTFALAKTRRSYMYSSLSLWVTNT